MTSNLKKIKLSLITINFNGYRDTIELLESIFSNINSCSYEVIVVDNGSNNSSEILDIQSKYPQIIPIRSEKNLGFAGGNNLGLSICNGDYIMLINNDVLLCGDPFKTLINRFESDSSIGAISPKLLFAGEPPIIQFAGYTPLSYFTMRNRAIGFGEPDDGRYNDFTSTPYCHGAAMMIKRDILKVVGKMPEVYFLYYEEIDWSTAISNAGYKLYYDPSCTMIHKESRSVGKDSPTKVYYLTRNRFLYASRNFPPFRRVLSHFYQVIIALPKSIFINIVGGNYQNAKAAIRGCRDYYYGNKR